ncbi:MAG TPA: FtsX-like permease family protein [Prolixibacteraceae bacterium]|nr:FtsX-like permease family protein [Prolixibacteraceae bacterium]HPS12099.1 FtsX-like permease family protein [Prolixibacteraceae bacterium]
MIWSLSWKNIWRNKKRSFIVICAVTLGVVAGIFTAGLMKGWVDQRVEAAIYTEVSHIKIRNQDYLLNEEIKYTIPDQEKVVTELKNNPDVVAFTSRIKLTAMAASSRGNTALMLVGIDRDDEKKVSNVFEKMVPNAGSFFETKMENPVVISDRTAEALRIKSYELSTEALDSLAQSAIPKSIVSKLEPVAGKKFLTEKLFKKGLSSVLSKSEINKYGGSIRTAATHYRLRSKIVFTFTGTDGEMCYQTLKVCGIYKTSNAMFDQMNAYVLKNDITPVAGFTSGEAHEIGIILKKEVNARHFRDEMKGKLPELNVMCWQDLAPDASMSSEYMNMYYYIIMGFILFALAFGIINTMLMAILERTKELGMLMAIGMNKKKVFRMIMLETIFLTMVGAIAGMILGYFVILITSHTGLDFSSVGEGFEAMGWSSMVYPEIELQFFIGVTILVILTGILSSIIPARKALSLKPIEAIRTE